MQGVLVLHFTADVVTAGHDLGGFQHRDISRGHALKHRLGLGAVGVFVLVLGQRQRLDTTRHGNRHFPGHDAFGGHTDTHQARGAHTVNRHARHRVGQAAGVGAQAPYVVTLSALLRCGAHDHVFHRTRLDTGTLNHGTYHMAAQYRRFGVVERTTEGFAQRGTGGGNDHNVIQIHAQGSLLKRVEGVAADGVHHAAGALAALDFDADPHHYLQGLAQCFDLHDLAMPAHPRTHLDRCRKTQAVAAVVDAHGQVFELHQLRHKQVGQGQGQVAVGNAGTERPVGGALGIDMNPLVIPRRIGKQVDPLLGQQQPVGAAQVLPGGGEQLPGVAEYCAHGDALRPVAN